MLNNIVIHPTFIYLILSICAHLFGLFNNSVFLHLTVSINCLVCFVCDLLLYLFTDVAQSLVVKHICQHKWFTLVQTVQNLCVCSFGTEMTSFVCFAYDSSSSLGGCVFLCKTHSPNTFESCALRGQTWPCGWWVWNSPCSKYWLCNIAVSPVIQQYSPMTPVLCITECLFFGLSHCWRPQCEYSQQLCSVWNTV